MRAALVLALLALAFVLAGLLRLARGQGRLDPASKTWLLVGAIFALVGAWLRSR